MSTVARKADFPGAEARPRQRSLNVSTAVGKLRLAKQCGGCAQAQLRPIVEALLAAGKHVLCEKPMAPTVADAEAMAETAGKSDRVAAVGFTFRRSPAINAIREQITGSSLGKVMHFNGHYWCDYGFDKDAPIAGGTRAARDPARSRTSAATWWTSVSSSAVRWTASAAASCPR